MSTPKIPFQTHVVETTEGHRFALQDCASTAVSAFAWQPDAHELAVLFKSDDRILYVYSGVPAQTFEALQHTPSKGSFIMREVKPKFEFRKELIKPGEVS